MAGSSFQNESEFWGDDHAIFSFFKMKLRVDKGCRGSCFYDLPFGMLLGAHRHQNNITYEQAMFGCYLRVVAIGQRVWAGQRCGEGAGE